MPRYRLPVDAVLLIFAAAGIGRLAEGVGKSLSHQRQGMENSQYRKTRYLSP